jgi:uncharacterized protein YgfB (UPF0149 family)
MLIAEKHGLLLDFKALSKVIGKTPETLANLHYAGQLGIPMKKDRGRLVAHYEDVADYIDSFRSEASARS